VAGKPPGAKDLVKACLTVDPTKRATAQTVLAHPWINGNAPDVAIDIGNLRKFQAARKLKAVRFAPTPGPPAPHASAHHGAHPGQPRPCPPACKCSPLRASLIPTGGGEDHGDEVGGHRQPREGSARGGAGQVRAPW